jgi:RNA polymerase sigma-70 factor (ECF subfamily)
MALRVYEARREMLVIYAGRLLGDPARGEDIVQDAWLHFATLNDPDEVHDPEAYLRRMVRNLAIDALRRDARYRRIAGEDVEVAERTVEDKTPSAEQALIARQDYDRIRRCLTALPERQRIAIEMHRIGGFKMREIAEQLGVSIPYVHNLIARGIAACDAARDEMT